jgi:hypothetical protein
VTGATAFRMTSQLRGYLPKKLVFGKIDGNYKLLAKAVNGQPVASSKLALII